jgi:putative phosphoesterase
MRIAVLADIHGNLPALQAVMADLRRQGPDGVYVAGDLVNRLPWSNEVLDLAAAEGWPAIAGNHELILLRMAAADPAHEQELRTRFPDLWWTRERIGVHHLAQISQLPDERTLTLTGGPNIRMVHGIPGNPLEGFAPEQNDAYIAARIGALPENVLIGAHTHQPLHRAIGRWTVLNPGSVGMPYNGDPRAQYLVLDGEGIRWRPTFHAVSYDIQTVMQAFAASGLLAACGPLGLLYLRTIETGLPWVSDFLFWMRSYAPDAQPAAEVAVERYLARHGPGQWAFAAAQSSA